MKTIQVEDITKNIREMCIEANHFLTEDMKAAMEQAGISPTARAEELSVEEWIRLANACS